MASRVVLIASTFPFPQYGYLENAIKFCLFYHRVAGSHSFHLA